MWIAKKRNPSIFIFGYDDSHYKGFYTINLWYETTQILTIGLHLNDLLFHFDYIFIVDQQFKACLDVIFNKITFVTS
jgi:hypothetical protein